MTDKRKILAELKVFIEEAKPENSYKPGSPNNKIWVRKVERRLAKIYGQNSSERASFSDIPFLEGFKFVVSEYTLNGYKDMYYSMATQVFNDLIHELDLSEDEIIPEVCSIYISHHPKDEAIAKKFGEITAEICPSLIMIYSWENGEKEATINENWKDVIDSRINRDVLVLPFLSPHYLKSIYCLREFGAASVLSAKIIPILIPPFDLEEHHNLVSQKEAINITDGISLSNLKDQLESIFSLTPMPTKVWSNLRNEKLVQILQLIEV